MGAWIWPNFAQPIFVPVTVLLVAVTLQRGRRPSQSMGSSLPHTLAPTSVTDAEVF